MLNCYKKGGRELEYILNDFHRNIPDEELLNDIVHVAGIVNSSSLTKREYNKHGKYSSNTIERRFGGWNNALSLCGITPNSSQIYAAKSSHDNRNVSTEELLNDIRLVAEHLGKNTISSGDYTKYGTYSRDICFRRFKTWNDVLIAANLSPFCRVSGKRLDDEVLFAEIERIWISLGRQPTATDIKNGVSKYSLNTFTRHFGGWRGALSSFVMWINSEESRDTINNIEITTPSTPTVSNIAFTPNEKINTVHKSSRDVNLRLRFLVMKRDNFKCCCCGASPAKDPSVELHIDHIKPWSKGGETTIDNLRTLCSKCNFGKSDIEG